MTGMAGIAVPAAFVAMPESIVIASEARQSIVESAAPVHAVDCHGPAALAMTVVAGGLLSGPNGHGRIALTVPRPM
jgi:hypothetical protein